MYQSDQGTSNAVTPRRDAVTGRLITAPQTPPPFSYLGSERVFFAGQQLGVWSDIMAAPMPAGTSNSHPPMVECSGCGLYWPVASEYERSWTESPLVLTNHVRYVYDDAGNCVTATACDQGSTTTREIV